MHSTGPCRHKPRLRLNISQSISFVTWRRGPMSLAYHTHQLWNKLSEEGCHLFTLQVPVNGMLHHVTQKTTKLWNRKKNGMLQSGSYNLLINTVATNLQLYTSGSRDMSSCKRGLALTQTQRWWGLHTDTTLIPRTVRKKLEKRYGIYCLCMCYIHVSPEHEDDSIIWNSWNAGRYTVNCTLLIMPVVALYSFQRLRG